MAKRVLVTGMSGLIGGMLKEHLQRAGGYELTALNRRHVEGVTSIQADIADMEAIKPAFEGQDVVVHLSAFLGSPDWEGHNAGHGNRRLSPRRRRFRHLPAADRVLPKFVPYIH